MLRTYFLMLLLTLTAGCGRDYYTYDGFDVTGEAGQTRIVDVELEAYVQKFESEWGQRISFRVKVSDIPEGKVGMCTTWTNGDKLAEVDRVYVDLSTPNQVEQVVMHELGHCALGRGHDNGTWTFSGLILPDSVMRSYAFTVSESNYYGSEHSRYMDELFHRNGL